MSQYFGKAVQTAYVVPDMEVAIQRWTAVGVGPFFVMREMLIPARYCGTRHDIVLSAAFGYSGSMMYELVQQHNDAPSAYRDFLAQRPEGGFHHLGYYCDSFDAVFERARARGRQFNVTQEFITPDGHAFEIYCEAANSKSPIVVQLMLNGTYGTAFEQMEAAAVNWDGAQPIRSALELFPQRVRPAG
ncbi:MAG: VOC family protein [Steroidobacteraceae bacterium]